MRFWLQFGQRGRSIAAIAAEDTGLNSGMGASCVTHCPTSKADGDITSQIGLSGIACLFNIAHFEKLNA